MEQPRHIISFSTHRAAVNYLQSQSLLHHQWINQQLQQLQLLDKYQPNLHVSSTILQLVLQKHTYTNVNYSPEFNLIELYHML